MSQFKLNFTLRQHTPHLHFLHKQQESQPLRLTELKAKLDRLICRHHFKEDFEKAKEHLVGYSTKNEPSLRKKWKDESERFRALDYRLAVQFPTDGFDTMWAVSTATSKFGRAVHNESGDALLTDSPYFADNDKDNLNSEELKKGILHKKPITLQAMCFDSELLGMVNEYLPMLFALENFGCRQSKGFGCYWPEGHDFEKAVKTLVDNGDVLGAWRRQKGFQKDAFNDIFRDISKDYRVVKSGFNHPFRNDEYRKSLLFQHFAKNGVRWEKRKIKQEINKNGGALKYSNQPIDYENGQFPNNWKDHGTYDYRYVRAMLGLAEQFEFQAAQGDKIKVKINHPDIERFRSPITIKVIDGKIYWLALAEKTKALEGRTFDFSAEQGGRSIFRNLPIAAPTHFDLRAFLAGALTASFGYQPI